MLKQSETKPNNDLLSASVNLVHQIDLCGLLVFVVLVDAYLVNPEYN